MGGVLGCVVGYALSLVINAVAVGAIPVAFHATVTYEMIALGIGFSVAIGVVSGLWPARRAAKLQPVDALRYE